MESQKLSEVDAFKVCCQFSEHLLMPLHKKFVDRLVVHLLTNLRCGAPARIQPLVTVSKRRMQSIDDEEDIEVETHDILPLSQYITEVVWQRCLYHSIKSSMEVLLVAGCALNMHHQHATCV